MLGQINGYIAGERLEAAFIVVLFVALRTGEIFGARTQDHHSCADALTSEQP